MNKLKASALRYEKDFYGWTIASANLLRNRKFDELDINNLVEEIESMGRSEKRGLVSHLAVLIAHLLKWQYQPGFRTRSDGTINRSWQLTIKNQRSDVRELLDENPSLEPKILELIKRSYSKALIKVEEETGLHIESFPPECPYTPEECLNDEFYPN